MSTIILTEQIRAPKNRVFSTIADSQNFARAVPDVIDIEFLSDINKGVGTRFKETRLINGKENTEELEVTKYLENEHIRLVTDNYGTVWDSLFTVREKDGVTETKARTQSQSLQNSSKADQSHCEVFYPKRNRERPASG